MNTVRRRSHRVGGIACVMIVLVLPAVAFAGSDYSDKDFAVRFAPAFIRLREVTTAGGESAANRWSSALNPASADWEELPAKMGLVAAPYYSYIHFDEGTAIHLTGEALVWDTKEWGTLRAAFIQLDSNRDTNKMGLKFDFEVHSVDLLWAKRFDDLALGVNFNFAAANTVNSMGPVRVAEGNAESYRFRFGVQHQCTEKLVGALVFEYGFAPSRASVLALTPFGPMTVKVNDTQHQFILRPAVSLEYADRSVVYVDYQYGVFFNDADTLHNHRFNAGVDHRLLEWLWVRLGGAVDARGNFGWTAGVGAYFSEYCSIDVGYQFDTLPEVRPEFGRSQSLQIVFSIRV